MKVDKIHKPVVFRHLAIDHEVRWPSERWSVKEMNSYCLIPSWREFSGGSTGRRGLNRTQRSPWAEETKIKVARTCRAVTQAEENYSEGVPHNPHRSPPIFQGFLSKRHVYRNCWERTTWEKQTGKPTELIRRAKNNLCHLDGVVRLFGASSHALKGWGFNSRSQCIPGLQVWSQVGVTNQCFSLSLSPPPLSLDQ